MNTQEQILNEKQINELENIKEYADRFHHDTNTNWQTLSVNDGELRGFVRRALNFTTISNSVT